MGRAVVPPDFRARLEAARLDTLALLRALDRGLGPHPALTAPLATLGLIRFGGQVNYVV